MTASGKRPQGTGSTDDQAFDSPFPKHLQPSDRTFLNARHDAAISIKNSPVLPASVSNDYSPLPFHDTLASANHDKHYYQEKNSVFDATLAMTVLPKLSVSVTGMLLTGFVLSHVFEWKAFKQVPELFILVPVLLNLHSTLEHGLQARLASAVSVGVMSSTGARKKIIMGNCHLLMFQSIVAGLIAGFSASVLAWLFHDRAPTYHTVLLMLMTSVATTISSSFLASVFILGMFAISPYCPFDLEIFSGPLSSAAGSGFCLTLLAVYSGFFHWWTSSWFGFILGMFACVGAAAYFFYRQARRNEAVRSLAAEGWLPLVSALIITGISGLLLEKFISLYKSEMIMFLPVFNGVSQYVGSIYCAESITHLHLFQLNPFLAKKTALTLLILANPIHVLLSSLVSFLNTGKYLPSFVFLPVYIVFCNVHVLLLIALADWFIKLFWRWRQKPDALAASLMLTVGDLAGTLLLATVFWLIRNPNEYLVEEAVSRAIPPQSTKEIRHDALDNASEPAIALTGLESHVNNAADASSNPVAVKDPIPPSPLQPIEHLAAVNPNEPVEADHKIQ